MTDRVRYLDDRTANASDQETHEWSHAHHRDVMRDLVIVALDNTLGDDGFTYGPWFDSPYNETTLARISLAPANTGLIEQCEIVSPARRFTLYIGEVDDNLLGINHQGKVALYDLDELLDNGKLIQEVRTPFSLSCF